MSRRTRAQKAILRAAMGSFVQVAPQLGLVKVNKPKRVKKKSTVVQYWIVPVFGGVDPAVLIGPFTEHEAMRLKAVKIKDRQGFNDSIFYLVLTNGVPSMECFTDDQLELKGEE